MQRRIIYNFENTTLSETLIICPCTQGRGDIYIYYSADIYAFSVVVQSSRTLSSVIEHLWQITDSKCTVLCSQGPRWKIY